MMTIDTYIKRKGSIRAAAEAIGMTALTIFRYKHRRVKYIHPDHLRRLAELGIRNPLEKR